MESLTSRIGLKGDKLSGVEEGIEEVDHPAMEKVKVIYIYKELNWQCWHMPMPQAQNTSVIMRPA